MRKLGLFAFVFLLAFLPVMPATAQTGGPVYIVQPGDTLSDIAARFNVSTAELMQANNIANPDQLAVGQQLIIPGMEGISGTLITETVAYGDNFRSLSRRTQTSPLMLRRLNRIISPGELYAGTSLIIPQSETSAALNTRFALRTGETLLEAAVRQQSNPWTLVQINGLAGTWAGLPNDVLYAPSGDSDQTANGLPPVFVSARVSNLPLKQGGTAEIHVQLSQPATLGGLLVEYPLHFFPDGQDGYVALQGIHAMLEPGIYPLRLEATLENGTKQAFEQMVLVVSGYYPDDPLLYVDAGTIDPTITQPETDLIYSLVANATPLRLWGDTFYTPASQYADSTYFTSRFGNRRTYIGQGTDMKVEGFHTGLDFGGGTGLPITAPAPGIVVFAQELNVRGKATIIDHGWGVYSGFWHQSEIKVQVGQRVEQGEVIGLVGGTGRVTGAHLHWEIWVNGVQVDPLDWLEQPYPRE